MFTDSAFVNVNEKVDFNHLVQTEIERFMYDIIRELRFCFLGEQIRNGQSKRRDSKYEELEERLCEVQEQCEALAEENLRIVSFWLYVRGFADVFTILSTVCNV